jgi:hypothetical protein
MVFESSMTITRNPAKPPLELMSFTYRPPVARPRAQVWLISWRTLPPPHEKNISGDIEFQGKPEAHPQLDHHRLFSACLSKLSSAYSDVRHRR